MKRGEIYYITRGYQETGSEQQSGRPAVIVSNDMCNAHSTVLEVVYLTTQPKTDLPTHVDIRSAQRNSVAICEQISSVSTERFGDYIGECTDYEMQMLEAAMAISLDLRYGESDGIPNKAQTINNCITGDNRNTDDFKKLVELETKCALYKDMYENLLSKVVPV